MNGLSTIRWASYGIFHFIAKTMIEGHSGEGMLSIVSPLGRDNGNHGGITPFVLNLSAALGELDVPVELVSFYPDAEPALNERLPANAALVSLPGGRHASAVAQLKDYFRKRRPARVLAAGHRFNVLAIKAASRLQNGRVYAGIRNTASREIASMTPLRRWRWLWQARRYYARANGVIAVSQGVARDIAHLARLPTERVSYAYNPVITDKLYERMRAPIDHPWLAAGEPPVIVAVGRLEAQKDYPTLLSAYAQLRSRRDCRLLILGEGARRAELEAMIRRLGLDEHVAMPGFVDNPVAYVRSASVYALSSVFEGIATALVEALATGTPLVATDCEHGPREVLASGRYGHLVPVGDASAFARALEAALDEPRRDPAPAAIRPFQPRPCAERYLKLMQLSAT
ncbi:glycosyltransferase [Arhodomonas sp. SL1]|uniref:glycosyltransferase n=1 Tax=Arhodomonas sp. SL1 TaxID=3425691 RepID=UPI003F8835DD